MERAESAWQDWEDKRDERGVLVAGGGWCDVLHRERVSRNSSLYLADADILPLPKYYSGWRAQGLVDGQGLPAKGAHRYVARG